MNDTELDRQIEQAIARSEAENLTQPRAKSVHFNAEANLIVIALKNGAFFSFPPHLVQELAGASPEALNNLWLDASGSSVHWDSLEGNIIFPLLDNDGMVAIVTDGGVLKSF